MKLLWSVLDIREPLFLEKAGRFSRLIQGGEKCSQIKRQLLSSFTPCCSTPAYFKDHFYSCTPTVLFLSPPPIAYDSTTSVIKTQVSSRMGKATLKTEGCTVLGIQPKTSSHETPWFNPTLGFTQYKLAWHWGTIKSCTASRLHSPSCHKDDGSTKHVLSSSTAQLPQTEGTTHNPFLSSSTYLPGWRTHVVIRYSWEPPVAPFLINTCVTDGFGRAMDSSSLSAAEEPSSNSGCKYGYFQKKLRWKTQESAHRVSCTGGRKTPPKDFTGVYG